MANAPEEILCVTCEDFDARVIDLVYDLEIELADRQALVSHEAACASCAELGAELRETRKMTELLPEAEPPAAVHEHILEVAGLRAEAHQNRRFARFVEPVGWLAAASFLLSCGYVMGFLMSHQKAEDGVSVARKRADSSGLAAAPRRPRPLVNSSLREVSTLAAMTTPVSFARRDAWSLRPPVIVESRLLRARELAEQGELKYAWYLLQCIETEISSGRIHHDGLRLIDDDYRQQLSELKAAVGTKIPAEAREQLRSAARAIEAHLR